MRLDATGIDYELSVSVGRWPNAADALDAEKLASGAPPSRPYEATVTSWVLFDEKHFPDGARKVLPSM